MKRIPFILNQAKVVFVLVFFLIFPLLNALSQTPGDVNTDGFINHGDFRLVKDHLLDRDALDTDSLIRADANQDEDEVPRHEVTLSAYYIGKYEITNGQYCEVLNWAKGKGYLENSSSGSYTEGNVYKIGNILLNVDASYCQISYSEGSFTRKYPNYQQPFSCGMLRYEW